MIKIDIFDFAFLTLLHFSFEFALFHQMKIHGGKFNYLLTKVAGAQHDTFLP